MAAANTTTFLFELELLRDMFLRGVGKGLESEGGEAGLFGAGAVLFCEGLVDVGGWDGGAKSDALGGLKKGNQGESS